MKYGSNPNGILSATPIDPMHLFQLGVLEYLVKVFLNTMSTGVLKKVDDLVASMLAGHRCSDRDNRLRINFTRGITRATLLTAKEWSGLVLALYQMLLTDKGRRICQESFQKDDFEIDQSRFDSCEKGFFSFTNFDSPEACKEDFVYNENIHVLPRRPIRNETNEVNDGNLEEDMNFEGNEAPNDTSDEETDDDDLPDDEAFLRDEYNRLEDDEHFTGYQVHDILGQCRQIRKASRREEVEEGKRREEEKRVIERRKRFSRDNHPPLQCSHTQFVSLLQLVLSFDAVCNSSYCFVGKDLTEKDCFSNSI